MKVADQVWVTVASLQKAHPNASEFTKDNIEGKLREEFGTVASGVVPHIYLHCVANLRPNPGRYRMLYQVNMAGRTDTPGDATNTLRETSAAYGTKPSGWRLFRPCDTYAPEREGSKMHPEEKDLPEKYIGLLH